MEMIKAAETSGVCRADANNGGRTIREAALLSGSPASVRRLPVTGPRLRQPFDPVEAGIRLRRAGVCDHHILAIALDGAAG